MVGIGTKGLNCSRVCNCVHGKMKMRERERVHDLVGFDERVRGRSISNSKSAAILTSSKRRFGLSSVYNSIN